MNDSIVASNLAKPLPKVVKSFNDLCRFKRFNRWIPLEAIGMTSNHQLIVKAACDCGNLTYVKMSSVKNGSSKSCGCIVKKHGLTHHPLYRILHGIIQRTTNPNLLAYKNYGGRGIVVCQEWLNNPAQFVTWAESNGWAKGLEIDRIDNNSGYSPVNCRFVTRKENNSNRRNTRHCDWDGEIISFQDAANRLGKAPSYLHHIEDNSTYHLIPSFVKIIPQTYVS
jgi:hypothetical protein